MIDASVTDVVLVHHVHYAHHSLWVMCGITVNLHIEDMSAACEVVVGCFYLSLVQSCAMVIYRHVVAVGIVLAVCDARK